jgi:hypothetical protein
MPSNYLASYVIQCVDGTREYGDQLFAIERLTVRAVNNARNSIRCPSDCMVVFLSWTKLEDVENG